MKKKILTLVFTTGIIGLMTAGCSSNKAASGSSDSTKVDSANTMSRPAVDTVRHDSTKTPPNR